jgi:signal transduction histidine kinase
MLINLNSSFAIRMSGGVNFKCLVPKEDIIVKIDKNRLNQVINNYLSNAIKYTPNGEIELGYKLQNKSIQMYVKDTGIGIDKNYHDRVFQRFEKFDSFAQGTGLGLSICKAIAESMGCSVGFTSDLGKGSCFWIQIPL